MQQHNSKCNNLDNNVNILYNSIKMDNFLRLHNLDRHLQLYDINGQQHQTININILYIAST
jgi:hypothetical protein